MVEIANSAVARRASASDFVDQSLPSAASPSGEALGSLTAVPASAWRALSERAIEPNGYYLPDWALAVDATARGRTGVSALCAFSEASSAQDRAARLIGLLPVVSM